MYVFYSNNPLGINVGDCVIRAISKALDMDWDSTYLDLIGYGYKEKDMPSANHVWGKYLTDRGFKRFMIPDTCPSCYTVKDFCEDNPVGTFILATGNHVVCIIDENYFDSWDSGNEIPIYFFQKRGK